jgi:hypothetical protein
LIAVLFFDIENRNMPEILQKNAGVSRLVSLFGYGMIVNRKKRECCDKMDTNYALSTPPGRLRLRGTRQRRRGAGCF